MRGSVGRKLDRFGLALRPIDGLPSPPILGPGIPDEVREDSRVIGVRSRLLYIWPPHFDRLGLSGLDGLRKHPPNVLRDREVEPP